MAAKNKLSKQLEKEGPKGKLKIILLFIVMTIVLFVGITYVFGNVVRILNPDKSHGALYYGFSGGYYKIALAITVVLDLLIALSLFKPGTIKNKGLTTDARGLEALETGIHGSERLMSKEEIPNEYNVFKADDLGEVHTEAVYGKFPGSETDVVCFKAPTVGGEGDRNTLVLGSPGTGKSYGFVRTELIQTVYRGHSFVATDPKGELYTSLAGFCREHGMNVKVLNLVEPEYSDCWNCLAEVIDPMKGRLDPTRLNDFVSIYMTNSSTSGKEDAFFFNSASNLLKAAIGLCAYRREDYIRASLSQIFKTIGKDMPDYNDICNASNDKNISLVWLKNKVRAAAEFTGIEKDKIEESINEIYTAAPPFSISVVMKKLMDGIDASEFETIPDVNAGKMAYQIFAKNSSETVVGSAMQGILLKLNIFTDNALRCALSNDGMNLSEINGKPNAWFVITSDKSNTTKPITSLFFSFLFKDAEDAYDEAQKISEAAGVPNPRIPVTVMMDEFFSIGMIPGFDVFIATCRSRRLFLTMVLQGIGQMYELYGENSGTAILTCTGTIVFLGCNDPMTADFISKFATGEGTFKNESHAEVDSIFGARDLSNQVNVSAVKRNVYTPAEARRHKGVLLVKRGKLPLKLEQFGYPSHPAYKKGLIHSVNIYKEVEPLSVRMTRPGMHDGFINSVGSSFNANEVAFALLAGVNSQMKFRKKDEKPKEPEVIDDTPIEEKEEVKVAKTKDVRAKRQMTDRTISEMKERPQQIKKVSAKPKAETETAEPLNNLGEPRKASPAGNQTVNEKADASANSARAKKPSPRAAIKQNATRKVSKTKASSAASMKYANASRKKLV